MEDSGLEATQDFFDLWLKAYETTYGKLIEMPIMGPTREHAERLRSHFDATINLYSAWMGSIASFQSVFLEATRRTREKVETMAAKEEEVGPESAKEFYDLWMETFSETFKEFLKSQFFSSDLSKLASDSMGYMRSYRDMLENNLLKPANLPTRTELDEINKDVYELRKQVKSLKHQINELAKKEST